MVPLYKINKILNEIKKEGKDPDVFKEKPKAAPKYMSKPKPQQGSPQRAASPSKLSEASPSRPQSKYA